MDERSPKTHAVARKQTPLTALALAHRARSAHLTQAAEISTLSRRAGLADAQVWATSTAMQLTPDGLVRMLRTVATIRDMNATGAAMPARDSQQRVTLLRGLAAAHAEPPSNSNEVPTTPSRQSEGTRQIAARPPATGPATTTAAAPTPWTEQRIGAGLEKLATDRGVTAPAVVELMKSYLRDPSMTVDERAASLGRTNQSVVSNTMGIREQLGIPTGNLRIGLAERIGMPYSEVVARIRVPGDAGLTRRVMNTINPSHRERVAELLLTVQVGSAPDVLTYRALDSMFRGGDPFASKVVLSKQLDLPAGRIDGTLGFLSRAFAGDRIAMLRTMGFDYQQIMSMNPVGAEIGKRFDPALGTYSAPETAARRAKNLPCTREEAAERLLRVGVGNVDKIRSMSYRSWLTVGLVSDNPSAMPSDISAAFDSVVPSSTARAGEREMNTNFRIAQVLLNREIPRGARLELQDRNYRAQINLLLLQTFGLGATRVGSGRLESIATEFKVSDWPSPVESTERSRRAAPAGEKTGGEATWQQLLPLLQRRQFGAY